MSLWAISLWQPWASLWLVEGAKEHETRHWRYPVRLEGQRVLVHAAKRKPDADDPELNAICREHFGQDWVERLPRGAFIGSLVLAGCFPTEEVYPSESDEVCGNWAPGRFAWKGAERRLGAPRPAIGRQGFWKAETAFA